MDAEVVVVGAGVAGLTAARRLEHAGRSVVVLEARDRVGGRTYTVDLPNGEPVDLGGQWVGPTQDRVLALIAELGIETFATYDDGELMARLATDAAPVRTTGATFGLPKHVLVEVGIAQQRLERMARSVPLDAPWRAAKAARWDGQTAESWITRNLRTKLGRQFWRLVVVAVFSCEATDVSLLHFAFYCHSGGLWDRLLGTTGGAQQDRIVGGAQTISTRMAASLSQARLGVRVRAIEHDADRVVVHHDGGRVTARRAVVAIPPTLAGRIEWRPGLGGTRSQLHQNVPMGSVIKTMTVYERPFWRDAGLNGQAVSLVDPVSVVFDNSPADASCGILLAFIEGRASHELRPLSTEARRRRVEDQLVVHFGSEARRSTHYVEQDWAAEELSGGCYGGRLTPGVWTQLGPALAAPIGPIHWAGTETSDVWSGYIDGAVRSGERTAREVHAALPPA
jgi:monoamine oxidase